MLSPREAGLMPLDAFRAAHIPGNATRRLDAIRAVAPDFKKDFVRGRPVIAVRTMDVSLAPYPVTYAFNRACRLPYPYMFFQNRSLLIQFWVKDKPKLLLFNPTIPDRSEKAPFFWGISQALPFSQLIKEKLLVGRPIPEQLRSNGVAPEDIDYVAFDHQHVQDLRPYLGTDTEQALYPNARFLVQRPDYEASLQPHPLQKPWFVPGAGDGIKTDKLVLLDGDVMLGEGCVLLYTPGHTWGNQSLLFRAPHSGCYTVSENGVCLDAYAPQHSTIPGIREHALKSGEEVILNANTLEGSLDQYNSMVKERLLADPFARDPRFVQHFSSSELAHTPAAPMLRPTHTVGRVHEGMLEAVVRAAPGANGHHTARA